MSCAPAPLALPIGNVTLSNGKVARGIPIGVGTPPQQFAFVPQPDNNTYIYDAQSPCNNGTAAFCTTFHGGKYNADASSSSKSIASAAAGGAPPNDKGKHAWVEDQFTLNTNFSASSFVLGIDRSNTVDWYSPQMSLGIGANSTILTALKESGKIASRTWSMFWGLTGMAPSQQSNGTFVFGGYDAAKVSGSNYTRALGSTSVCGSGMLVTVSNIQLQYPNGTSPSLYSASRSTAINACILPEFPGLMTLPLTYFEAFEEIAQCDSIGRSFGYNYYDMTYDPSDTPFYGNFVLEIDSSISITIPNSQILTPEISVRNDGTLAANYSVDTLLINSIQQVNANDLPILGRQFLSAAMVMVNQDTNMFTLWQASPSDKQSLVAVDAKGVSSSSVCASSGSSNNSTTAGNADPNSASSSSSTPIGAIVGGVIGGLALLALLAGLVWFLLRRRKSKARAAAQEQQQAALAAGAGASPTYMYGGEPKPPLVASDPNQIHEVPGAREPAEMPASQFGGFYALPAAGTGANGVKQTGVEGVHELG